MESKYAWSLQKSIRQANCLWSMKQALRTQMSQERKALSPVLYAKKSASIREKIESLEEFQAAKNVLIYVSKTDEVDTHALIKDCLEQGQTVYVPKVKGEELVICPINDWHQLEPGNFGVLEPCEILDPLHPKHIDFVLVPGLAFSTDGHRLGYGGGFYDRLLKETNGHKVGLAFHEQIVENLPTESHDVALDLIVTDQTIISP